MTTYDGSTVSLSISPLMSPERGGIDSLIKSHISSLVFDNQIRYGFGLDNLMLKGLFLSFSDSLSALLQSSDGDDLTQDDDLTLQVTELSITKEMQVSITTTVANNISVTSSSESQPKSPKKKKKKFRTPSFLRMTKKRERRDKEKGKDKEREKEQEERECKKD